MPIQIPYRTTRIVRRHCLVAAWVAAALSVVAAGQDFSHTETQTSPAAAMVEQANAALAKGDMPEALKILTRLNTEMPHNTQILYDLGMTTEALGPDSTAASHAVLASEQTAQPTAESFYREAVAADRTFAPPQVALGLLLARTGHATEARTTLLAATALTDVDPALEGRAYRALARLELASTGDDGAAGNVAAASSDLLDALKVTPEQPEDILLSAEIAQAGKDLTGAEQAYRRYLALPGEHVDAQTTAALGGVLVAEGHLGDAESLLTPALAQDPDNPAYVALLAQVWLSSGDAAKIARAAPLVESLHAKDAANDAIARLLARIYMETGHPEQAEPLYAGLIAAQKDHPEATLLDDRGEALIRLHRPGEAERLLKQAVADRAGFPTPAAFADAATHLAFAADEIDDPATTLQALALRDAILPPSPSSLFLGATANDDLHQSRQAADLYRKFLVAAQGTLPDQEAQARRRLVELEHRK